MTLRNFLVIASLVLSVLIGLLVSGRGSGAAADRSKKSQAITIGFSLDTLKEARWLHDRDDFTAQARALGATVLVQSANGDDTRQISDCQSLISRGVNVLVIVPHDAQAMAKVVRMAHRSGIRVISYDRLIRDSNVDLYVTFDNVHVGELQAQYLLDQLHLSKTNPPRIVRIYGAKTDNNAHLFKQGQDQVLAPAIKAGLIKVVHADWAEDWRPENAKKIMNAAITDVGRNIAAVLASNDGTAGGAIQALKEVGLAGKVVVTGQDASLVACQRIVGGTQSMTVYKPIKLLARGAARLAIKLAKGEPIIAKHETNNGKIDVPTVLYKVETVTKHNMVNTVIADGFHSYDSVYRSIPANQRPPRPAASPTPASPAKAPASE